MELAGAEVAARSRRRGRVAMEGAVARTAAAGTVEVATVAAAVEVAMSAAVAAVPEAAARGQGRLRGRRVHGGLSCRF